MLSDASICHDSKDSYAIFGKLCELYDANRLPHAVLFLTEYIPFADAVVHQFANKVLNCTDCTQYPDFFSIAPEDGGGAQITADAIRGLIGNLQVSPKLGRLKIAYVRSADHMNRSAANSFLKTLEEPPGDTVIFLSVRNLYAILPTILSRCVVIRLLDRHETNNPVLNHVANMYEAWLEMLYTRQKNNLAIIDMYKLLSYIEQHINEIVDDNIDDKSGTELLLLKILERSTAKFFLSHAEITTKLYKVITIFERSRYFLAINCNIIAYLEHCFILATRFFENINHN